MLVTRDGQRQWHIPGICVGKVIFRGINRHIDAATPVIAQVLESNLGTWCHALPVAPVELTPCNQCNTSHCQERYPAFSS